MIAFFCLMRSLLLEEFDRGDPADAAAGAGCRLAVATVTVSSDEHEHASSSLLSAEQVAAAGNIIFLYYDYGSWYPVFSLSGIRSIMMAIMANGRGASCDSEDRTHVGALAFEVIHQPQSIIVLRSSMALRQCKKSFCAFATSGVITGYGPDCT